VTVETDLRGAEGGNPGGRVWELALKEVER
jgi:hypothetical protein